MPRTITDFEAYNKNTKEQYEALGRFVVAFEAMVNEIRNQTEHVSSVLVDITFHHSALTAMPLFEVFRALIIESLSLPGTTVTSEDKNIFQGVLKTIASEYSNLTNIRNKLLHGTWYIGYTTNEDPNSDTFFLRKFKPTSGGLAAEEDVPSRAFDLLALSDRCDDTRNWIAFIHGCVPGTDRPYDPAADRFIFKDAKWRLSLGADVEAETLPRKSQ